MPSIGAPELIILLLVVLLLFGSTRLPKLARSMGEASREFKKGVAENRTDIPESSPAAKAADENVTMSRAELDALLERERKAKAREDSPPLA